MRKCLIESKLESELKKNYVHKPNIFDFKFKDKIFKLLSSALLSNLLLSNLLLSSLLGRRFFRR